MTYFNSGISFLEVGIVIFHFFIKGELIFKTDFLIFNFFQTRSLGFEKHPLEILVRPIFEIPREAVERA